MTKEAEIIFALARASTKDKDAIDIDLNNIDISLWKKVMNLSIEQGIPALAITGLQNIYEQKGEEFSCNLDLPENDDMRYEWFSYQLSLEVQDETQMKTIAQILSALNEAGLKVLLIKGFSLRPYWPIPAHRPVGDIDIYVLENGYQKANSVLSDKFKVAVSKQNIGHHSHIMVSDTLIENHCELSNTYFGSRKSIFLEKELAKCAQKDYVENEILGQRVFFPSADFNALFLIWHMSTHFCIEKINIRMLMDWTLFLKKESAKIDWEYVGNVWKHSGLYDFATVINGICVEHLGLDKNIVPPFFRNVKNENLLIEDIFNDTERKSSFLRNIFRYYRNGWKYSLATGSSWIVPMMQSIHVHLFHKKDLKEVRI